jgi:glycosyltransferase involved in cell wall biosynthesis
MIRLDKLSYRRDLRILCVSEYVARTVRESCSYTNVSVLKNFVSDDRLAVPMLAQPRPLGEPLRIVAIGHLKAEKNYELVIDAFKDLKDLPVEMDVYGLGDTERFNTAARGFGIGNLHFRGLAPSPKAVLPTYHLYTMTSFSEACPLSPIEAAAAGLPLLLSDIPSLLEIAPQEAVYFRNGDAASFAQAVRGMLSGEIPLHYGHRDEALLERYSSQRYFATLSAHYDQACSVQRP